MLKHLQKEDEKEQFVVEGDRYGFNSKTKEITKSFTESNSCKTEKEWQEWNEKERKEEEKNEIQEKEQVKNLKVLEDVYIQMKTQKILLELSLLL